MAHCTFGHGEAGEERVHGGGEWVAVDLAFKLPQKKRRKEGKGKVGKEKSERGEEGGREK